MNAFPYFLYSLTLHAIVLWFVFTLSVFRFGFGSKPFEFYFVDLTANQPSSTAHQPSLTGGEMAGANGLGESGVKETVNRPSSTVSQPSSTVKKARGVEKAQTVSTVKEKARTETTNKPSATAGARPKESFTETKVSKGAGGAAVRSAAKKSSGSMKAAGNGRMAGAGERKNLELKKAGAAQKSMEAGQEKPQTAQRPSETKGKGKPPERVKKAQAPKPISFEDSDGAGAKGRAPAQPTDLAGQLGVLDSAPPAQVTSLKPDVTGEEETEEAVKLRASSQPSGPEGQSAVQPAQTVSQPVLTVNQPALPASQPSSTVEAEKDLPEAATQQAGPADEKPAAAEAVKRNEITMPPSSPLPSYQQSSTASQTTAPVSSNEAAAKDAAPQMTPTLEGPSQAVHSTSAAEVKKDGGIAEFLSPAIEEVKKEAVTANQPSSPEKGTDRRVSAKEARGSEGMGTRYLNTLPGGFFYSLLEACTVDAADTAFLSYMSRNTAFPNEKNWLTTQEILEAQKGQMAEGPAGGPRGGLDDTRGGFATGATGDGGSLAGPQTGLAGLLIAEEAMPLAIRQSLAEKKRDEVVLNDIKMELSLKAFGPWDDVSAYLLKRGHPLDKGAKGQRKQQQSTVPLSEDAGKAAGKNKRVFSVARAEAGVYTFVIENKVEPSGTAGTPRGDAGGPLKTAGGKAYAGKLLIRFREGRAGARVKEYAVDIPAGGAVKFRFVFPEAVFWDDEDWFSGVIEDGNSITKYNSTNGFFWKEEKDF
ncbi:MAG: hypothetical protein HY890_01210 [Deltaproteobacteria bacterium]|nr:hypothetical protein [Deltaproteobacteria bacterium]